MAEIIRKQPSLILLPIVLLSVILSVWRLNLVPSELFGDELDVGYQAYSILKTGKDLQGNFLPVYFESLAESRAPLFLYSAVPFIAIFGLNEWGVRLTAAFWGVLGVAALYFLTFKLFSNRRLSIISSLLLAISPWHLQYSRAAFEVTLLSFILIAAVYFFISALEKPKLFILSAILFSLMPYTYSTGALFMPLFLFSLVLIFKDRLIRLRKNNFVKISALLFVLILVPFLFNLLFGAAAERFQSISIALNPAIEKNVNEGRQVDGGGAFFHNKPLAFLYETSRNYVWAFSPQFLFVDGDPNLRHSVGQMGELYWFFLPLLLIGTYTFIKSQKISTKYKVLIFSWVALAPLPASLTYSGTGHATRLFLLLVPLIVISAIGIVELLENSSKKGARILILTILIIGSFNLITYFHRYYVHYPRESWRFWQIGYRDAMAFILEHENEYDRILINNTYEPSLIRFLFYQKYDPQKFHQEFKGDKEIRQVLNNFDGFSLEDKYFFGSKTKDFAEVLDSKTLYLASARDESADGPPSRVKILKTVENPFGEPIFYLVTGEAKK